MQSLRVPDSLTWWRRQPGGAAWLARLPAIATACAERWSLELGAPFTSGHISLVVPARRADGSAAVLKVNFPHRESEREADALRSWAGNGAVSLLGDAPELGALLVRRLRPGTSLWDEPDEGRANEIAASVLRRLWRPVDSSEPAVPFNRLDREAGRWAAQLPERWERGGRAFERELLDEALRCIAALISSAPEEVLLHQDLHGGNVLWDGTDGWLAIDPKPLVGERAFDVASLLRDRRRALMADPRAPSRVRHRLERLSRLLLLDRERMRGWGIVHALAWSWLDDADRFDDAMVACARWLAEA